MSWLLTNFLAAFLLPPLNFLILGIAGLLLLRRRPRAGKGLIGLALALTWIFSMHLVSDPLLALLERDAHTPVESLRTAQAIVVLSGGPYFGAPEFGGDTVNSPTLQRLRLAVKLHRATGLPLLVSGGLPGGGRYSDAALMKKTLEEEFGVPVRWVEGASDNTRQSAAYSMNLLAGTPVRKIALVTHAWHMPRARSIFERAGFEVVPAGTAFQGKAYYGLMSFLPTVGGMRNSVTFMHEAIGLLWYRFNPV